MINIREKIRYFGYELDFPFYNNKPKLSYTDWLIVLLSITGFICLILFPIASEDTFPILLFLITLIPALYICKGDYKLLFRKPERRDFILIFLCFIGYYIYSLLIGFMLLKMGYTLSSNIIFSSNMDLIIYITLLMQLLGEELFKIFVLLLVMYVVYRFTSNRSMALYAGIIVTLLVFGLIHITAYGNILQIILIQGVGSIFNLYVYLQTKNVAASYILHILIDFPLIFVAMNI